MRILFLALLAGCARVPATPMGDNAEFEDRSGALTQITLSEDGGRVDWSGALDLIAFDRLGADGHFDVWTMRPDGRVQSCFTCELPSLPRKNVGQPAWHPSAAYLIVQAQDPDREVSDFAAHPGRGVGNELWAISFPDGEAVQLTRGSRGVLHPHFSSDGSKLTWSEMTAPVNVFDKSEIGGTWVLKSAELVIVEEGPRLENVQTLAMHDGFYENHGLSPDGARWIFTANLDRDKRQAELNDIYLANFPSGAGLQRLTTHGYNEHAAFLPDGRVVWMSSAGNPGRGTDYWMASPDGSGLQRLTRLGPHEGAKSIAADLSVGPDGKSFVGYIQDGVVGGSGRIILFRGL